MNKINSIILSAILLLTTGVLFSACSDDDDRADKQYIDRTSEVFQHMKGDYTGSILLDDNTSKNIRVSIADDANLGTTCVTMSNFPMEKIFSKLNPNSWQYTQLDSAVHYVAPIDSGSYVNTAMIFKTDDERTPQITFNYKDADGQGHNGWAQVSTTGTYLTSTHLLELNFQVTDLVIDNQDRTGLLPILFSTTLEPAGGER